MVLVSDEFTDEDQEGDKKNAEFKTQQKKKHNLDSNSNRGNNSEVFLSSLLNQYIKTFGYQIKRAFYFIMIDLGGYQLFNRFAQWCVQHPEMAILILAAGFVTSLPVLLFMAFALSTIVMTFTGFLVLEGTLLTILTMIMFGLLGALATVLLFFGIVGVATYCGVSHVFDMYGSTEPERTNLRNEEKNDPDLNSVPIATNFNQVSQVKNVKS